MFQIFLAPAFIIGNALVAVFLAVAFIIRLTVLSVFVPPPLVIGATLLPVLFVPAFFGSAISLPLLGCSASYPSDDSRAGCNIRSAGAHSIGPRARSQQGTGARLHGATCEQANEGSTEVWSYASGNGQTNTFGSQTTLQNF
jgi:hypothetical protein